MIISVCVNGGGDCGGGGINVIYWVVSGVGITCTGLGAEILGAFKLVKTIFISDDEIKKLNDLPIYETTTVFSIKEGGHMNAVAIRKDDLEEFKKDLIEQAISERDAGRLGFAFLIIGLGFQIIGVLFLTAPQVVGLC